MEKEKTILALGPGHVGGVKNCSTHRSSSGALTQAQLKSGKILHKRGDGWETCAPAGQTATWTLQRALQNLPQTQGILFTSADSTTGRISYPTAKYLSLDTVLVEIKHKPFKICVNRRKIAMFWVSSCLGKQRVQALITLPEGFPLNNPCEIGTNHWARVIGLLIHTQGGGRGENSTKHVLNASNIIGEMSFPLSAWGYFVK